VSFGDAEYVVCRCLQVVNEMANKIINA
jgi:hypothetical protein